MAKVKREWRNPELIVLVRNRPAEAVLTLCKGPFNSGDQQYQSGCYADEFCEPFCQAAETS